MKTVCFLVDKKSFPKNCPELHDLMSLLPEDSIISVLTDSPTTFFKRALELTEDFELVVPVTRNLFIRDRLRQEGVTLVICI